ncbi:MAG: ATP-binding protein, partial [Bacteroidales bacterium]|nr:ATP-binding protein [Bacteroidales bacterium]
LYTDGVVEAENETKEIYTTERLIEIAGVNSFSSAKEITGSIEKDVRSFAGNAEQSDDITIMTIHYMPTDLIKKEITFKNELDEIPRIAAFIEGLGEELGLSAPIMGSIQLAIEEAAVNVIEYAYPDKAEGLNSLSVSFKDGMMIFVLTDCGTPFDPTAASEPDITLPAEQRPVGGLGIMLVKKIMNTVTYLRIDGQNKLTMTKQVK